MGREMGGQMLGGGIITGSHEMVWDHISQSPVFFASCCSSPPGSDESHFDAADIQAEINAWHHVAMVYDGSRLQFLLDGVHQPHATNDQGELLVRDTPIVIGQAGPGTEKEYFEVRLILAQYVCTAAGLIRKGVVT